MPFDPMPAPLAPPANTANADARRYRRARELLIERGWHQGGPARVAVKGKVPLCLGQALSVAWTEEGKSAESGRLSGRAFRHLSLHGIFALIAWNDAKGRTLADVFHALERAAQLAESESQTAEKEKEKAHAV